MPLPVFHRTRLHLSPSRHCPLHLSTANVAAEAARRPGQVEADAAEHGVQDPAAALLGRFASQGHAGPSRGQHPPGVSLGSCGISTLITV